MDPNNVPKDFPEFLEEMAKVQDEQGTVRFVWRTIGLQYILTFLVLLPALLINWIAQQTGVVQAGGGGGDEVLAQLSFLESLLIVGIVGPFIETVIFHFFLIEVTRFFTKRQGIQLLVSASLFCLAHFSNSLLSGLLAGGVGGLVLAMTYLIGRQRSVKRAFIATFLSHAVWNLIIVLLVFGIPFLIGLFRQ